MLSEVFVRDFRCFEEARLRLHPETTMLVGRNAQGKTSLLEAVCVLMRLQSPRTSTRTDLIRFGAKAALVEGSVKDSKLRFGQSSAVRRLAVDDSVCGRSADYLKSTMLVVWMDYSDMQLVRSGAEHRRRYLDFAAAQLFPHYLTALRNYDRTLRSRNFILKRDAVINWRQVEAYARLLQEHGQVIAECRRDLAGRLQNHVSAAHRHLSGSTENVTAIYEPGFKGEDLEQYLWNLRPDEEKSRTTLGGTHRDDIRLELNGREAGVFSSEGQQRTLSLALKLAQARVLEESRGEAPLLLMDDIFGELDKGRRRALLDYLPKESQKIITTTFMDWAQDSELQGEIYQVDDGKLSSKME